MRAVKLFAGLSVLALSACSVPAPVASPVSSPSVSSTAPEGLIVGTGTPTFERPSIGSVEGVKTPTAVPVAPEPSVVDGGAWVASVLARAGVSVPVPVQLVPSIDSCNGMGPAYGCTIYLYDTRTHAFVRTLSIQVLARLVGTEFGKYVVIHEAGHANGIMGECEADRFAEAHGADPGLAVYC